MAPLHNSTPLQVKHVPVRNSCLLMNLHLLQKVVVLLPWGFLRAWVHIDLGLFLPFVCWWCWSCLCWPGLWVSIPLWPGLYWRAIISRWSWWAHWPPSSHVWSGALGDSGRSLVPCPLSLPVFRWPCWWLLVFSGSDGPHGPSFPNYLCHLIPDDLAPCLNCSSYLKKSMRPSPYEFILYLAHILFCNF